MGTFSEMKKAECRSRNAKRRKAFQIADFGLKIDPGVRGANEVSLNLKSTIFNLKSEIA
jgi:hypothetical protein